MLLGPKGDPISSGVSKHAKPKGFPIMGEVAAPWTGLRNGDLRFPIENSLQFDTSKLTLADYRMMKDHYQINSSLTILSFMLHQIEWRVECDDIKIAKFCEDNLREVWTRLIRAISQAFWAGYSPCVLQWENDNVTGKTRLTKIKDLRPEDCRVHWKEVPGKSSNKVSMPGGGVISSTTPRSLTPKVRIFDGIDAAGYPVIPVSNSFWFPLLMENGNYYGRKILNSAFQPWFFSNLIHYYANRYFERYGEPTIVARAPFDEKIDVGGGSSIQGNILMANMANRIRSGGSAILPNTRAMNGLDGANNFEYTLEYLESQMRGADFERYLTRFDQEISLALFTPLLMMNTGDSGASFNLGIVHTNMYDNMVAAVGGDGGEYINKYILAPMARFNFGPNAKLPKWKFRKPGKVKEETLRTIILSLINNGNGDKSVKINLDEVGQELGMTLEEIERVQEPAPAPAAGPDQQPDGDKAGSDQRTTRPKRTPRGKGQDKPAPKALAAQIAERIAGQFVRQLREEVAIPVFDVGHSRALAAALDEEGAIAFVAQLQSWVADYYDQELHEESPLESRIRSVLSAGIEMHLCDA